VAAIRQTLARGALALSAPMRPQQWLNLLHRLGHPTQTQWNGLCRKFCSGGHEGAVAPV